MEACIFLIATHLLLEFVRKDGLETALGAEMLADGASHVTPQCFTSCPPFILHTQEEQEEDTHAGVNVGLRECEKVRAREVARTTKRRRRTIFGKMVENEGD